MLTRLRALAPRALPNGWPDVVRQVLIFAAAYYAYRLVRGAVDGHATAAAFEHARDIIGLERVAAPVRRAVRAGVGRVEAVDHRLRELDVRQRAPAADDRSRSAFLYLFRNRSFYFVRNMFVVSMGIALVGYVVFPTAPPRLFPEWGFADSVSSFIGFNADTASTTTRSSTRSPRCRPCTSPSRSCIGIRCRAWCGRWLRVLVARSIPSW